MKVYIHKRNDDDGTGDFWEMVSEDYEPMECFYGLEMAKKEADRNGYEILNIQKKLSDTLTRIQNK